jgi:uncharacterized membrane protein HdeD (DUF308 family)
VLNNLENVMATSNPSTSERRAVEPLREDRLPWELPLVIGILMILGGMFALYASVLTSLVTVLFLGALLVAIGVLEMISAFRHRHQEPFIVYFLAALLSIVVGGLFIARPLTGLASLNFLIIGYLFAIGLFRGVAAIANRYARWGWDLLYAAVTVALGIYLVATWPVSALWVLGTLVAIEIIARGITLVAASSVLRRLQHGRIPALGTA